MCHEKSLSSRGIIWPSIMGSCLTSKLNDTIKMCVIFDDFLIGIVALLTLPYRAYAYSVLPSFGSKVARIFILINDCRAETSLSSFVKRGLGPFCTQS